jgi:hypothetical protein
VYNRFGNKKTYYEKLIGKTFAIVIDGMVSSGELQKILKNANC